MKVKNLSLLLFSILVGLIVSELVLIALGKYDDLVEQGLKPSNTVYTRYQNNQEERDHPDLHYPIEIMFDRNGIRNHTGVPTDEFKDPVGFFGDSFTENRRIEDRFSVSSILNELLGSPRVINFGVENFGLEQSFQRYLNFEDRIPLEYVVYIFCANDLDDLNKVHLFDIEGEGILVNRVENRPISTKHWILSKLGRLRLTYLVVESAYRLRGKWNETTQNDLNERLYDALEERFRDHRIQPEHYFTPIDQALLQENISDQTIHLMEKFNFILSAWDKRVAANGAGFSVVVLPGNIDQFVFRELRQLNQDNSIDVVYLPKAHEAIGLGRYSSYFGKDHHWNEVGNLAALPIIYAHLISKGVVAEPEVDLTVFLEKKMNEIEALYKRFGFNPPGINE